MSKPRKPDLAPAEEPGGLRGIARQLASRALADPRVHEATAGLKNRAESLRVGARERADQRLEELIESRHARQGDAPSQEVSSLLAERRQEREARAAKVRAREAVLAVATTTEERRVLLRVLDGTPWAGGEGHPPRYTQLLDALAPSGDAEQEMAVHRAIWGLAEREVLAVSPFGEITARPLGELRLGQGSAVSLVLKDDDSHHH